MAVHGLSPERLRPTTLAIAPPVVVGLGALQLGAPEVVAWMRRGMALFALLWVGTQARALTTQPCGLAHRAIPFPLAAITALAALALRLTTPGTAMAVLGPALFALASIVGVGLALATVRGLRAGRLLAPEAPAPFQAAVVAGRAMNA